jgi:hypothetical protein
MFCASNKTYTCSFATKKKAQAGRYRLKSDQNATKLTVIYFVRLKPDWMWLRKSVGYNWQPAFAPIAASTIILFKIIDLNLTK